MATSKTPKPAAAVNAVAAGNALPSNVMVAQPPNGAVATYGNLLVVGRKVYGGSYYNSLTAANYALANTFTAAVLTTIKGSTAAVTPAKLSINAVNVHGTPQRVCVLSFHGQVAQVHIRYLTAAGHAAAAAAGITVYGPVMHLPVGKQGPAAHSNHILLTAANLPAIAKVIAHHASTIQ